MAVPRGIVDEEYRTKAYDAAIEFIASTFKQDD